jgi:hypothetical protein
MARIIHGGRSIAFYTFTNGTTPTVGSTAVFTGTDQISTDVSKDDSGVATITLEQVQDDSTLATFIRTYAPTSEGGGIEDLLFEDGSNLLGAASGTQLFAIVKGGVAVNGTARKVWAGAVSLSKASGSWSQAGNTYSRPTIVATSVPLEGDIAIGSALFSGVMTTATTVTLDSDLDKYGVTTFG